MSCQSPGDVRPAVNQVLRPISCAWLQGSRSRPSRSSSLCVFLAGALLFPSLAAGEGLKIWEGCRVSCCVLHWHVGCGMGPGFFLFSLLFLEGCLVSPCLIWFPRGIAFAGHVSYWAPLRLSGAFKVVARRTVLGIGVVMNLKGAKYAAAFERKENATFAMMMKFNTLCFTYLPSNSEKLRCLRLACGLSALFCK